MFASVRTATLLAFSAGLALSGACSKKVSEPVVAASAAQPMFINGDFEAGSLTGWAVSTYLNPTLLVAPPTLRSQLNLMAGGSDLTRLVTGAAETVAPAGLSASATLRVPKYGNGVVVVNEMGAGNNVNALKQSMVTTNADVDPADNKVHVRFALAPVLQNPGHGSTQQPYFWATLTNLTKGNAVLFYTFNYSNQTGVPWKSDPSTGTLYTDWQSFDISPGNAQLAVGDTVELEVIAAGCAQGGHYGHVYVDGVGPALPGISVAASAPQEINTGSTLTYTFNYRNGGAGAATNTTIVENLPAGVTFASVNAPGASCTTPSVGGTGTVSCDVGTVNPAASGSITVTVNVTAGAGSSIANGDYSISATGVSALIGPLVTTLVTSGVVYANLGVTMTDGLAAVGWGQALTYTLVATNHGPGAANGATLTDAMPALLTGVTWTCAASGGAACASASGSGNISTGIPTFPSGGSVTYTIHASVVSGTLSASLINQATIAPPGGVTDNDSTNNDAVDTDAVGTLYALTVQKTGTGQGTVVSSPAAINCGPSCTPSQAADFLSGTSVVLTATAGSGWVFNGWSGAGCSGSQPTCTVAVNAPTVVSANFGPVQWTVTGSAPGGNGTVSCTSPIDNGSASTCTITPNLGYRLSGLTDGGADVFAQVSGNSYTTTTITANRSVVGTFLPSISAIALSASPASSHFGQSVLLTATVSGVAPSGTPTGTVTFLDGGSALSGCSAVALSGGVATCTRSTLSATTHSLTATYSGDSTWNGSTSGTTSYAVAKAVTTLTLGDNPAGSSLNGVPVTLTATVAVVAPGAGTPTGTVAFTDGGGTIAGCGAVTLTANSASCTTAAVLGASTHIFAATYSGDLSFANSTNSLSHAVLRVAPVLTLATGISPSQFGEPITFSIGASHALGAPTGQVSVYEGATVVCGPVNLSAGAASCSSQTLTVGTHVLTVQYGGDASFLPTTSGALSQLVVRATTSATLVADMGRSVWGQTVTLTATVTPDAPSLAVPTGTVTFRDSASTICTDVTLNAGVAVCQTSTLSVSWHSISARYSGSAGSSPTTSFSYAVQVDKAAVLATLSASPASVVVGQASTFTISVAAVLPGVGLPTGTISVTNNGAAIAGCTDRPLTAGVATCSTAALPVGDRALLMPYAGDGYFAAGTSGPRTFTIAKAATSVNLATTTSTRTGQSATFTATVSAVAPGAGQPSGTITFKEGATPLGTGTVDPSTGIATFTTSALSTATHTVTATYDGDASFTTSTSSGITHVVQAAATAVALIFSPTTPVFGQPVTLTATVTVPAPGVGLPTGTVTFKDGATTVGTGSVNAATGVATLTLSTLSAGAHTLTAVYGGDASFLTSTSAGQAATVGPAQTTTVLGSAPNPSLTGEGVTYTATVAAVAPGAGIPTGTVTFSSGATSLGSAALNGAGVASLTSSALAVGAQVVTAVYGASAAFAASTSAGYTQTIHQGATTLALGSSLPTSTFGDSVTFTATASAVAPAAGTPTGTVVFKADGTVLTGCGAVALSAGHATCTTATLRAGAHAIIAEYSGNTAFTGSATLSFAQLVNKASTTATAIVAAPNPSVVGQSVTLTATVTSGPGTPSGTVTFKNGAATLGDGTLAGGIATFTTATLTLGGHSLTAVYSGDSDFLTSTSAAATATVGQASSGTVLAISPTAPRFGEPVQLTATVSATAPGAGTPTGTVTFRDGGTVLGTGGLNGSGVTSFTSGSFSTGGHSFTATYNGSSNFGASASAASVLTVAKSGAAVVLTSSAHPSFLGQSVTLTATVGAVAPGAGVASGTITFSDGAAVIGTGTLSGGVATFRTAALLAGIHELTATYSGDGNFLGASGSFSQVVQVVFPVAEAFRDTTAPAWTLLGSAHLTAGNADPAGQGWLQLTGASGAQTGEAVSNQAFSTDAGLVATFTYATYGGSGADGFSFFLLDGLTGAPALAAGGGSLGYSATLASCGGSTTAAGVTGGYVGIGFDEYGGFSQCNAGAGGPGQRPNSVAVRGSGSGSDATGFRYLAGVNLGAAPFSQNVATGSRLAARQVRVTLLHQKLTVEIDFGAGYVKVLDSLDLSTAAGQAALPPTLKLGFGGTTGALGNVHEVRDLSLRIPATLALVHAPTPALVSVGDRVTFTITATNDDINDVFGVAFVAPAPAGLTDVTWTASPAGGATVSSANGSGNHVAATLGLPMRSSVTFTVSGTVLPAAAGTTLVYASSVTPQSHIANLAAGTASSSVPVAKMPTSVLLGSAPNPSVAGETVTLTATVLAVEPGSGTPSGTVTFQDGQAVLGTGTLDASGLATFTTSALSVATHSLRAVYAGSASYLGAQSELVTHTVEPGDTDTVVSSAPNPSVFGSPIVLSVTVTASSPAAGIPSGVVTFTDGGTPVVGCTAVSLSGGSATCSTGGSLAVGAHNFGATYAGSHDFLGSTSLGNGHEIGQAHVTVGLVAAPSPSVFGQSVTFTATVSGPGATPSGSVTFSDGDALLGTSTLVEGVATLATAGLATGGHVVTAAYAGDERFFAGASSPLAHRVDKASSRIVVLSAAPTAAFGDMVTLNATVTAVAPGAGLPTGTVTFKDGGLVLGTAVLSGGLASFSSRAFTTGTHTLTTEYAGDESFLPAVSAAATQTVTKASVAVLAAVSPTPSRFGEGVTLSVTVARFPSVSGFVPSGTVELLDGATILQTVSLNSAGEASWSTAALAVGSHSFTARYVTSSDYLSATSAPLVHVVNKAATAAVLTALPHTTVSGEAATLTAVVSVPAPGAGRPSGSFTFKVGTTVLGTAAVTAATGTATLVVASLPVGIADLTATYGGDDNFLPSASPAGAALLTVAKAAVVVTVTPNVNPSRSGQEVTFAVLVVAASPGVGIPTGTLTLRDGAVTLAILELVAGRASVTVPSLPVASHSLVATYGGDARFLAGTGGVTQSVGRADVLVTLTAPDEVPHVGQPQLLTARVTPAAPGTGTPSGDVLLREAGVLLGTATLAAGTATFTTVPLTAGPHSLTVTYVGDSEFNPGTGLLYEPIYASATATTLGASPAQSMFGQAVTLTATVAVVAPGGGAPAGTVTFQDGATVLGVANLSGAVAVLITSRLSTGSRVLTAAYSGSVDHLPSSGNATAVVQTGTTEVSVVSSRQPSRAGRPVVFSATVSSPHATPEGTIVFKSGETVLGSSALSGGAASLTVRSLTKGTHPITAQYSGADGFAAGNGVLTGGQLVENTPPVAGSGSALALGAGKATSAQVDAGGPLPILATATLWARATWTTPSQLSSPASLLQLRGGTAPVSLAVRADRKALVLRIAGRDVELPAALDDGAWHHLGLTVSAGSVTVLVDGVAVGDVAGSLDPTNTTLVVGEGFEGEVDELRLWSVPQSTASLLAGARKPLRGDEVGLAGVWRMDEGAGSELFDGSLSHLDLAIVHAPDATVFVPSTAWRSRTTSLEGVMAPMDVGYDADGDPLTVTITAQPTHGQASVNAAAAQAGYAATTGYKGLDQFTFTLSDGEAQSSYAVEVVVQRVPTCLDTLICGGDDVCVAGVCAPPSPLRAGGGGCSATDAGTPGLLWALGALAAALALRRRVRVGPRAS